MQWILDFDDTLVLGPNTWAFQEVLPDLIRTYGLPYDKTLFDEVMLTAQQQANEDVSEEALLNFVFDTLKWSHELKADLMNRVFNGYQPHLFEDVVPFLEALAARGDSVYIISNNNHATPLVESFGISQYFTAIITPQESQSRAKPHRDMWDKLQLEHALSGDTVMVGDDPWSDGTFAQRAGIPCWIVDRLTRYTTIHKNLPYRWVSSLAEIIA